MQAKTFLESVLSGEGYYCVLGVRAKAYIDDNGDEQTRVLKKQKLFLTIEEACHAADNLAEEGFNAYFALATFKTPENRSATAIKKFTIDIDPDRKSVV